ncbi:MAG: hypothetical protein HYR85_09545 [Planctomycetes bacterium]|nr:hypothetical protein [Planctomycetota bacterium]MBI3845011.1 hypothetical protein [Planctomycetota bacterium]
MKFARTALELAIGTLAIAAAATAQPVVGQTASALIFPLFDSTPNHGTIITVTNSNTSRISCRNGFRSGDVALLYTYFGFDTTRGFCREFNLEETLTPGDTLTVFADQHNPEMEVGWLWVEARDPESFDPITYNWLVGSAIIVDTGTDFLFAYKPYAFRSHVGDTESDSCDHVSTDVNGNGRADFDGVEYDFWPSRIILDEFFQEGGTNPQFENQLALASCDINFAHRTSVSALLFNNRETRFSRSFDFECFFRAPLHDISGIVRNLGGDPNELVAGNGRPIQQGWLDLVASDAILGVFFQRIVGTGFAAGTQLDFDGQFGGPGDSREPCSLPH